MSTVNYNSILFIVWGFILFIESIYNSLLLFIRCGLQYNDIRRLLFLVITLIIYSHHIIATGHSLIIILHHFLIICF